MLNSNNIDLKSMTDLAIARMLGDYIKNIRLQKNLTQNQIATKTGLNRSTISEIENGRPASFLSFIQLLRALDQLELLEIFSVKTVVSPLLMAKLEAKKRSRATANNQIESTKTQAEW